MSPSSGCSRCFGDDAATAWTASRTARLRALVEESHFSLQLTACPCGQRFVSVFTERIDWQGGEDDQTWLVVPVTAEESARLETLAEGELARAVTECARGRRFLVRSFPTGGTLGVWWRDGGFLIGPHD
ncbi:MAG: hypothetical protein ACOZQL_03535 [Myxococcota bacterium]